MERFRKKDNPKESKPEEFHGQAIFEAAAGVIKLLVIAYGLNAVVYSLGALLFLVVCTIQLYFCCVWELSGCG